MTITLTSSAVAPALSAVKGVAVAPGTCCWMQPSPLGPLSVTVGPSGVRRVWFSATGEESGTPDAGVADAFDAYFAGDVAALDALPVDLDGRSDFSRAVLTALRDIGPSRLTSYGELAAAIGRPSAARAVGRAVGANPVPLVIACHRVLAAAGALGGYSGGLDIKRRLLAHEGWLLEAAGIAST
ncbi:MAG TPA: methylated-DNA--[protein]-cysteine S-methyltransferase [Acidimicrobiales bacterium]|nr:methylated-DNA--[protein]-cysteine S-methyltransferase [Acidimicrobiales bacterium]